MFSMVVRLVYALTCFSLMTLVLEGLNVWRNLDIVSFCWNSNVIEGLEAFCVIHYPLLIFLLLLVACKVMLCVAKKELSHTRIQVQKSANIGMDSVLFLAQLVPMITLFEKIVGYSFTVVTFVILVVVLIFFIPNYGAFNLSIYMLNYYQYKVSTGSSEYWLISKRRIRDFSQSFTVVEISDKILLRI